ncbi:MAG: hypothetical protein FJ029_07910 [Actinobacteria bacterium]|nr:hypothetical protein [Actinomycetota bacterium]
MPGNAAEFDRLTATVRADERREARRLRSIRIGLVAVLAVAIVSAVFVIRAIQGAQAADLAAAESAVRASIAAQAEAYRTLDASGLKQYFDERLVAQMQEAIKALRARGVYVTGERRIEVAEAQLRNGTAVLIIVQTTELELRSLATGELFERAPRQQQAIGVMVEKLDTGRWRIARMQQLE